MSNKIEFKKAFYKHSVVIGVLLIMVISGLFIINIKNDIVFYSWIFFTFLSIFLLFNILNKSKSAECPHCKTDLFDIIELAKGNKVQFKFCPSCGNNLEIE